MRMRRLPIGLVLAAVSLSCAAIAWACNPQALLVPNKASYAPGEAMSVAGSFFPPNTAILVTGPGGVQATVVTGANGSFIVSSLKAPTAPGSYTVRAVRADGQPQSGLPKVASFAVVGAYPPPVKPPATPAPGVTGGNFVTDPTLRCGGRAVTLVGTSGNDVIRGSRRRDVIAGLAGDDVISGLGAGDVVCGGRGRDRIAGGSGDDRLAGGSGADRLRGGRGRDRLDGGPGRDRCPGDLRRDRVRRCEVRGG